MYRFKILRKNFVQKITKIIKNDTNSKIKQMSKKKKIMKKLRNSAFVKEKLRKTEKDQL